ncbi:hypothetical protein [Mycolicibacterium mageritense]|uniref:Uncharacterized protein n=1 Tax=Mycolicibacterium mageritense TaxID=53462 RepID=A0AAI8XJI8_MYCME|nr:hypothetical protein [Mycolicibacterium mageritense]BDY27534.1 hypothetical protein hbim_01458 [Mycolicibacterium mageritense]
MTDTLKLFATAVMISASAILGAAPALAQPDPLPTSPLIGDDNHDGVIDEDESGWDCTTMGNQICGQLAAGPYAWEGASYVGGYN